MRVYALVPAAGRGERFGGGKLLAEWRDRPLLGHVLLRLGGARAAGLVSLTVVMHRPEDDAIRDLARLYHAHPEPVRVNDAELSWSLRSGIEYIKSRGSTDPQQAVLICLGDQPLLRLDVIRAVVELWQQGGALAARPSYRDAPGEPGHPLLVDRSLWHLAGEMAGETGFGPVLARHGVHVRTVSVAGANPDVDTPADLAALEDHPSAMPA